WKRTSRGECGLGLNMPEECRACFCFQLCFSARSHEEATTSGDCGDAGTRYSVTACTDRHCCPSDHNEKDDQDKAGQGRPREEGGREQGRKGDPRAAGEDGRAA